MLLAIPFGLAIGVAVGTLGGGGSVLAVPILVGVDIKHIFRAMRIMFQHRQALKSAAHSASE